MKAKTRINPKTRKTEYKMRYLWKDSEGKRKDSETGWFPSEAAAFKNAQILKLQKETNAKDGRMVRNLVKKGFLPAVKIGSRLLFREEDVEDFVNKQFKIQNF